MSRKVAHYLPAIATIALVVAVYWPLLDGALVWDDRFYLHDRAWLRQDGAWLNFVLHGLPNWEIYFRPLGVALLAFEARIFDGSPAGMHSVSLLLHVINVVLVGYLAQTQVEQAPIRRRQIFVCVCMLVYGLHPALIEPVAWVSSQYELLVVLFMLLALASNAREKRSAVRCVLVSSFFFLAACSKESAVVLPLALVLFDWMAETDGFIPLLRRQRPVYIGLLCAGAAYLLFRQWALGALLGSSHAGVMFSFTHFEEICSAYMAYVKLIVWPTAGIGPLHLFAPQVVSAKSIVDDASTILIVSASFYLLFRKQPLGAMSSMATVALLPALHILPIEFDGTLYHDRYALFAIAMVCVWLPALLDRIYSRMRPAFSVTATAAVFGAAWLLVALFNVRVTLPLWGDELKLWRWALIQNPDSRLVQDALLATYIERGEPERGLPFADRLTVIAPECSKCMLNVAFLRLMMHDDKRAEEALKAADRAMQLTPPAQSLVIGYVLANGNLAELRGHRQEAEAAYRAAIGMDPLSPEATMNLALLQARGGNMEQAELTLQKALELSPADELERRRAEFRKAAAEGASHP